MRKCYDFVDGFQRHVFIASDILGVSFRTKSGNDFLESIGIDPEVFKPISLEYFFTQEQWEKETSSGHRAGALVGSLCGSIASLGSLGLVPAAYFAMGLGTSIYSHYRSRWD